MVPKPSLPDAAFVALRARRADPSSRPASGEPEFRESALDAATSLREIRIIIGQFPQAVQMLREQDDGHHLKKTVLLNGTNPLAQALPGLLCSKKRSAVVCDNREEEHASRPEWASIIRHKIIPIRIHFVGCVSRTAHSMFLHAAGQWSGA
jgi:hypothetical protein